MLVGGREAKWFHCLQVNRCLSIKGAEDILNKPHAFEVSTTDDSMFFIADTDKARDQLCATPPCIREQGMPMQSFCMQLQNFKHFADLWGSVSLFVDGICLTGEGGLDKRCGPGNSEAFQEVRLVFSCASTGACSCINPAVCVPVITRTGHTVPGSLLEELAAFVI